VSFTQKLFTSFHSYPDGNTRIGELNRIWYDSNTNTLRIQLDTVTPGGTVIAGAGSDYTLLPATDTRLGGVKVGDNIYVDGEGKISVDLSEYATTEYVNTQIEQYNDLGNLSVGGADEQTISGSVVDADIVLNPNGGSVQVPSLKVGTDGDIVTSNLYIEAYITQYELVSIVDYSTGPDDELPIGSYGNINGVQAPWTVFELAPSISEIPVSAIEINDVLTGVGIVPSVVQDRGLAGQGDPIEWSNYVIVGLDLSSLGQVLPLIGANFDLLRPLVKANFNFQSAQGSDIFLNSRGLGDVVINTNIVPVSTNVSTLGTPTKRWKSIYVGPGTIYVTDETSGKDIAIGARDNLLYVQNGSGLSVGEFTLVDNQIRIANPSRDIILGTTAATGKFILNRPLEVNTTAGDASFTVTKDGKTEIKTRSLTVGQSALTVSATSDGTVYPVTAPEGGSVAHFTSKINNPTIITFDNFSTSNSIILQGRRFRGTPTSLLAVQAEDAIIQLAATGYHGSGITPGIPSARLTAIAGEAFTTSSNAAYWLFRTQVPGSITPTEKADLRIDSTGITFPSIISGGASNLGITFQDNTRQTTAAIQSDWLQTDNTKLDYIKNKPNPVQGVQGVQGIQGVQGVKGVDGTSVRILGSVSAITDLPGYPNSYTGDIGDGYLNIVDGSLYFWDGIQWNDVGDVHGPQGIQGVQGTAIQGIQGVQGSQGINGNQGTQGIQGTQGTTGSQGVQGAQGITGNQGIQGRQGTQGTLGFQGTQGTLGNQGTTGEQGITGNQGIQGIQGMQASQGIQGTQAAQGIQGLQGLGTTYGSINSSELTYVLNNSATLISAKNTLLSVFGLTNGVTVTSNTRYQYELVFNLQANKAGVLSYALATNSGLVLAQHNYSVIANKTNPIDAYGAGITMMSKNLTSLFTTAQAVADTNNAFAHYAIWGTIDVTTGGSLNFMISQDQPTPITWSVLAGAYVKLLPIGPIGADSANGTWS